MRSSGLPLMTRENWGCGIPYCRVILFSMRKMKLFPICGRSGMMISCYFFLIMNGILRCSVAITA